MTMTAETLLYQNGVVSNGDLATSNPTSKNAAAKKSRESERRRRRRKQKNNKAASQALDATASGNESEDDAAADANGDDAKENADHQQVLEQVEVEYVPEKAELGDGFDDEFRKIFEKFNFHEIAGSEENDKKDESAQNADSKKKVVSDSEEEEEDTTQKEKGLSNKKKKLLRRMKIAELKQICSRPDVVEVWDATAADPKLLVFLKSYRNSVPVPRHWCQKRKFLQGKRGIEKQPFQLPDFIAATGIEKIRQAYIEKEDSKKLKQKQRERMQPKMGKMDIDYQVKLREMKPGSLSQELKEALGMPEGAPPPWLINMQRYGPPPSYPHLKIPGLNAPIPPGASFGYHPGGWGKPPVDEYGRPLYGDVFGVQQQEQPNYESVDSLSSTPTGVETPDVIDLRKQQRKEPERPLYQVLEEKEERIAPGTLLGTTHTYVVASGTQDKSAAKRVDLLRGQKTDRVDVTLQPEELDALDNVLPAKYEEAREEEKMRSQREDFSDMVAEVCTFTCMLAKLMTFYWQPSKLDCPEYISAIANNSGDPLSSVLIS
ncbi:hypothetical protein GH714_017534 [Hevea brasiliensis]|uniref:PSP proline-rich domain-containing protein n=1 Tax=Hevea brasiliensis TaxID=3981 RepID=A0A6A6LTB9_HEVBR|nr:hypothetical protein GH714_017534 [Hevea brasiliensis]